MKPDIVVTRENKAVLVLDTKYKRLNMGEIKHADVYQMYAYCSTLKVSKGILIYGEGEGAEYQAKVPEEGLGIETVVLRLDGNHGEFRDECERLRAYVMGCIGRSAN